MNSLIHYFLSELLIVVYTLPYHDHRMEQSIQKGGLLIKNIYLNFIAGYIQYYKKGTYTHPGSLFL